MSKAKQEDIKVIEVNPPTKQDAEERVEKLSEFLSNIWDFSVKTPQIL